MYKIYPLPNAEPVEVYCELDIDGGGFAFLPGSLTLRKDAQQIVNALFEDKKNVLLKFKNCDSNPNSLFAFLPKMIFDFHLITKIQTHFTKTMVSQLTGVPVPT